MSHMWVEIIGCVDMKFTLTFWEVPMSQVHVKHIAAISAYFVMGELLTCRIGSVIVRYTLNYRPQLTRGVSTKVAGQE